MFKLSRKIEEHLQFIKIQERKRKGGFVKGQSSAEFSIIFSIGVFLALIFFALAVSNVNDLLQQRDDYRVERVLNEWYYIANDVWLQGNGSSYVWRGSLPLGYDPSNSKIAGNTIILSFDDGRQYTKSFIDFQITGSVPPSNSNISLRISYDGEKVIFTPI